MSLFQETPLWFVIIVQLYVSMTTGNTMIDAQNSRQVKTIPNHLGYFDNITVWYLGKQTAILQEDGVFTTTSYLQHNNGIGDKPLEDFTFCLR